jgi:hypothetical protein
VPIPPTSANGDETPALPSPPSVADDRKPPPRRPRPTPAAVADESSAQDSTDQPKAGKAVLWLPKPTANRLRAISKATGYPLSRIVTAAVIDSADTLANELDGGVPLLRRRPDSGREVFTLWLSAATRATLKDLAATGGISASEVASRALEPFLDGLETVPTDDAQDARGTNAVGTR